MERAETILDYWFGALTPEGGVTPERAKRRFDASAETDRDIRERFGADLDRAARGEFDDWARTPRGRLALVVLLDYGKLTALSSRPGRKRAGCRSHAIGSDSLFPKHERTKAGGN